MRIGLDIGGSHIAIGLINENCELVIKREKDIKISESNNPSQALKDNIIELIEEIINYIGSNNIELIGIACPRKFTRW